MKCTPSDTGFAFTYVHWSAVLNVYVSSICAWHASPSPRLSCFAQRSADRVEVLQDLLVGLEHAGLVVGDGVIPAEGSDDRLCLSQLVAGHPREQVVFDLVVEAPVPEVG